MRRPHVFDRSGPRVSRRAYQEPANAAVVARMLAGQLTLMVEKADAAGLEDLAHCLDVARIEAEKVEGRGDLRRV